MYRQNADNLVKIEDFIPIIQNSATDVNEESLAASKFLNCVSVRGASRREAGRSPLQIGISSCCPVLSRVRQTPVSNKHLLYLKHPTKLQDSG